MNITPPTRFYALSFLVNALRQALLQGQWQHVLPPERELAQRFNVSRSTLRKALRVLEEDGLLQIQQGKPTAVCLPAGVASAPRPRQVVLVNVSGEEPPSPARREVSLTVAKELGQLGIEYREVTISPHTFRGPAQLLGQVQESEVREPIWIVFYPEERIEAWFAEHAPETTLLVGMGNPRHQLPGVDSDQQAIGRHIGMIANRHRYERLWLLCDGPPTSRLRVLIDGIREKADHLTLEECHLEPPLFCERFPDLLERIRPVQRSLLLFHEPQQVAPALFHLAAAGQLSSKLSLLSIGTPGRLDGFGIDLAHYESLEAKLSKAVVQQIVDLFLFPEQRLRQRLFVPAFHPGKTLTTFI